jgi:DnaJ like chaperone protein
MSWYEDLLRNEQGFVFEGRLNRLRLALLKELSKPKREVWFWQPWCSSCLPFLQSTKRQSIFLIAIFSMLAKLAKADGQVTREEVKVISCFIEEKLNLTAELKKLALQTFRIAKNSSTPFDYYARHYREIFRGKPEMLENAIALFLAISFADGDFCFSEERLISLAVNIFGLSEDDYLRLKSQHDPSSHLGRGGLPRPKLLDNAYAVLGCVPSDSDSQLKKRYRLLVKTYHPDRQRSLGVAKEILLALEGRFRQVQKAYEQVVSGRTKSRLRDKLT